MTEFRALLAITVGFISFAGAATAAETFRDCSDCPLMVNVPAGNFMMGTLPAVAARENLGPYANFEQPQHQVTIERQFAIGQYPVTRGEFAAFVSEAGYKIPDGCGVHDLGGWAQGRTLNWRNTGFEQTDRHPVVCVSFDDTQSIIV